MPPKKKTKCYCPSCGEEQISSTSWRFGVGNQGWAHHHSNGSIHPGIWLTDGEHEDRFPKSKIIQKDGGSCIVIG